MSKPRIDTTERPYVFKSPPLWWVAYPGGFETEYEPFTTHAEAIAYADAQARKDQP